MRPAVWAPGATEVELVHGSDLTSVVPLAPDESREGWWQSGIDLAPGTDYAFRVDGSPARPDPRSLSQPAGPHGPSRVFDPRAFSWTDGAWSGRDVRGAVVYELHVGTFTPRGTLDSAVDRLDHLVDLGVGLVELMPLAEFPGEHGWGYDGVDLYAVHHAYGGPAALQRFVDAAHARGLGVVLDVVYNHLGPSGNYLDVFGPYFTAEHDTPWGWAVNLDQPGSSEVRRWICDNAEMWLRDFHVDALRLDAVHELVDDSPRHVLAQLSDEVAELAAQVGRPLSLVAESDRNDVATITSVAEGGLGMTAQWADDVHHAVHAWITGERQGYYQDFGSVDSLRRTLTRAFWHAGDYSPFRGQVWGRPVPEDTDGHRFVVFAANHDQVGNRALGDRPSGSLSAGHVAISSAIILTSAFTPMLFMGDEWAASTDFRFFTDHQEPELGRAVSEGRTQEFGGHGWASLYGPDFEVPDPQDPETRTASVLRWDEAEQGVHARVLAWHRRLIALRGLPDLASGDLRRVEVVEDAIVEGSDVAGRSAATAGGVAADGSPQVAQSDGPSPGPLRIRHGAVSVLVNPCTRPACFAVGADEHVLASWEPATIATAGGRGTVVVAADSVTIVGPAAPGGSVRG